MPESLMHLWSTHDPSHCSSACAAVEDGGAALAEAAAASASPGHVNGAATRYFAAEAAEALPGERAAKRQRLDGGADVGGLVDGEVTRVAAQGPAACYVCRLADVPGKFRPDRVRFGPTISNDTLRWRATRTCYTRKKVQQADVTASLNVSVCIMHSKR
jgi:hypothetical protein